MTLATYLIVSLSILAALAVMIMAIAKSLSDCPETGRAARAGGVTITTGFTAIGGGAVLVIATLPLFGPNPAMVLFAMGLASLILGLGFTHAVTLLRSVVQSAKATPAAA